MRLLYPILLFFFLPGPLWACSCIDIRTFCETITYPSGEVDSDLIVLGEKTSDQKEGMVVRILEILYGEEFNPSLIVYRGNGADCGVDTDIFQRGEKLILALYRDDSKPSYYRLSICGVNYLQVDGEEVKGAIAPGVTKLPYGEFRKHNGCGFEPRTALPDLRVFPNPAMDHLSLSGGELDQPVTVRVKIRDMLGRQVGSDQFIDLEEKSAKEIPIDHLASGIYLLEISTGLERRQIRVMVQR